MHKILVVDDDKTSLRIIKKALDNTGFEVTSASDGKEALEKINEIKFDILLTDLNMPYINGIELTQKVIAKEPAIIVILITAYGTIRSAVDAIKYGAFDYLTKPVNAKELILSINRGLEKLSLIKENILLKKQLNKKAVDFEFSSDNEKIKLILEEANSVARSDAAVLITGEKGTGKEFLARYIHNLSNRNGYQFVSVDCSSIPKDMIETELFGSVANPSRKIFENKMGYFETTENGTIFIGDITSLDPLIQLKLLKVLEDRQFTRLGDNRISSTSARLIASSSEDLEKLVSEGKFNQNLYYKINVFEFHLPNLAERPEDILLYFSMFVRKFAEANNKKIKDISSEVKKSIINYKWPGNILELKNIAERATILCDNDFIKKEHLPPKIIDVDGLKELVTTKDFNENKRAMVREFETNFIRKYLKLFKGNVTAVSREINFHPVTLRQKIAKLGIDPKEFKNLKLQRNKIT